MESYLENNINNNTNKVSTNLIINNDKTEDKNDMNSVRFFCIFNYIKNLEVFSKYCSS